MKKLLSIVLIVMLSVLPFGCDDKEEKEECKCDNCPCEQIRDAEPEMEPEADMEQEEPEADMGLDEELPEDPEEEAPGGAEEEDLEAGDQDASDEDCECEGEDCAC